MPAALAITTSGSRRAPSPTAAISRRCKVWTLAAALLLAAHQPTSLRAQQQTDLDSKLAVDALQPPKQQQHPTTGAPPAGEHPSVNLIRVDQPVRSFSAASKPIDRAAAGELLANTGFEGYLTSQQQQQQQQELLQAAEQPAEVEQATNDEQAEPLAGYLPAEERNSELAREVQRLTEDQHQLERRFGLFKKGAGAGNQYGAPMMSGQYSQQPAYLSDCERCFANLNQQQQPLNADLIQQQQPLEPTPQVSPAPVTIPIPIPVPIGGPQQVPVHSYQQHSTAGYAGGSALPPLKSKFFNKFPFFMKGGSNQYTSDYEPYTTYWPQTGAYQQPHHTRLPSTSGALYLRPAAYNCVQAPLPSQFLSPLTHEMAFKGSPSGAGSAGSGTKGGQLKQYQQQQQQQSTYSNY